MREPVVLACEALRGERALNMGQCVDLLEIARDEDEARAMTKAYADYLTQLKRMPSEQADALARKNILFGLSYMERDKAHDLYAHVFTSSQDQGEKK